MPQNIVEKVLSEHLVEAWSWGRRRQPGAPPLAAGVPLVAGLALVAVWWGYRLWGQRVALT
jgi:hypothetical protein